MSDLEHVSPLRAHDEMDGKIKLLVSHPFVSDIIVAGLRAQQGGGEREREKFFHSFSHSPLYESERQRC